MNPLLHVHVNDPSVSEQVVFTWHGDVDRHSLMLKQVRPLPVYPALHEHWKLPGRSLQVAFASLRMVELDYC